LDGASVFIELAAGVEKRGREGGGRGECARHAVTWAGSSAMRGRRRASQRGIHQARLPSSCNGGGHDQAADEERVEQDRNGKAEPELLQHSLRAEHERAYDDDHDRAGGRESLARWWPAP